MARKALMLPIIGRHIWGFLWIFLNFIYKKSCDRDHLDKENDHAFWGVPEESFSMLLLKLLLKLLAEAPWCTGIHARLAIFRALTVAKSRVTIRALR